MNFCKAASLFSSAPVTFFIALSILSCSVIALYNKNFFYKMVLHPYDVVHNHHYYKVITSDLVHNDLRHLIVNEVSLFFIGGNLERHLRHISVWGSVQFALVYLASLLTGNLLMIIWHHNNIEFSTVGASGSIMGCVFGFIYLEPTKTAFYMPVIGAVANEYYAPIYLTIMVLLKKRIKKSGINYELHFWGALGGLLMTILIANIGAKY